MSTRVGCGTLLDLFFKAICYMAKLNISVQLYTLRDQVAQDLSSVLNHVKAIGFAGAEIAGYGNLRTAEAVKAAFDSSGLKVSGSHVSIEAFEKDVKQVLADQKALGNKNVIIPYLAENRRTSAADWRTFAGQCNEFGKIVADQGMQLFYHNHAFEFEKFDGQLAMDIFLEHADPKLVKFELDVYWIKHAGLEPAAYIKQYGDRIKLIHLKDMAAGEGKKFAPVGTGILDFVAISDAAAAAGVEWGVVEQDDCYGENPLHLIEVSYNELRRFKIA